MRKAIALFVCLVGLLTLSIKAEAKKRGGKAQPARLAKSKGKRFVARASTKGPQRLAVASRFNSSPSFAPTSAPVAQPVFARRSSAIVNQADDDEVPGGHVKR
jgi:hypothetical protein